eukprot:8878780-Alexandrium_andersonii.AAC.1
MRFAFEQAGTASSCGHMHSSRRLRSRMRARESGTMRSSVRARSSVPAQPSRESGVFENARSN